MVTGIYDNILIDLLVPIMDLGEPLAHADYRRHAGRRPRHAYMPGTLITRSDNADPSFA